MTTVLLIAVGLSIFFAVLKLADSIRDIAFEIREARRAMERDAANAQDFHKECLQAFKGQSEQQATRASLKEFLGDTPETDGMDAPEAMNG